MADTGTIANAYIRILPDMSGIQGELEGKLGSVGDSAGSMSGGRFASAFGTATKVGLAAVGAMAAGVTAASVGFVKAAGSVAEYGDAIDKSSQKLGISAEAYQEWDAVLQHSGTSIDSMSATFKKLANASQDATDDQVAAFEQLGLSMDQVSQMSAEDLFGSVITGLQGMEEGTQRTAIATELLGKGAMELGPLLNTSAEETQAMRDRVHELGGVMSDEAVAAAAAYQDSLQDMTTAIDGVKRSLIADFLPSVTSVMDGITGLFTGDKEGGLASISDGIDGIVSGITEKMPDIIDAGMSILESFAQAILDNLPKIMESGTQILVNLVEGIITNLPTVLNAGVQSIVTLATGLGESLPELIPAAVDAILTFVEGLLDNLPELIEAALQLMIGLATGLINAIPVIIERLPEIITAIFDALVESAPLIAEAGVKLLSMLVENLPTIILNIGAAVPQIVNAIAEGFLNLLGTMRNIGVNLISSLGDGLLDGLNWIAEKVQSVSNWIVNKFNWLFAIGSPSKVFRDMGGFLMQGLAQGINDHDDVLGAMNALSDDMTKSFNSDLTLAATSGNIRMYKPSGALMRDDSAEMLSAGSGSRNLTVILELDRTQLGRAVYKLNNDEVQRVGARLASAGGY